MYIYFVPLYFTKFSLKTVSIRVKFGSSKEKITTRRMYIYFVPDTNAMERRFGGLMRIFFDNARFFYFYSFYKNTYYKKTCIIRVLFLAFQFHT